MSKSSLPPAEAARRHERRVLMEEERLRLAQQRIVDERERIASTAAKTARLRQLREAREEAERAMAAANAKTAAGKAKGAPIRPKARKA